MTVVKYEHLRTLTSKVAAGGHFDLKILVTKFCLLGRNFMRSTKYFRYKKRLSWEWGWRTPPTKQWKCCEMWV